MKATLIALLPLLGLWSPSPCQAQSPMGLTGYEGPVEIQRPAARRPEVVKTVPKPLKTGDQVLTGSGGSAVLSLKDSSEVHLGPRSIFAVEVESPSRTVLSLALGKIWIKAARIKSREFHVRTSVAVASVRGTEFSVETGDGRTVVEVFSGLVAVRPLKDGRETGDEALLRPGERIEVSEGKLGTKDIIEGRLRDSLGPAGSRTAAIDLSREIELQLAQESLQTSAVNAAVNPLVQQGGSMIDSTGVAAAGAGAASGAVAGGALGAGLQSPGSGPLPSPPAIPSVDLPSLPDPPDLNP